MGKRERITRIIISLVGIVLVFVLFLSFGGYWLFIGTAISILATFLAKNTIKSIMGKIPL